MSLAENVFHAYSTLHADISDIHSRCLCGDIDADGVIVGRVVVVCISWTSSLTGSLLREVVVGIDCDRLHEVQNAFVQ